MGGGGGRRLLLARDPGGEPAVAGPTTIPETTAPVTSEPASSTSSSTSSSTTSTTSAGVSVQARAVAAGGRGGGPLRRLRADLGRAPLGLRRAERAPAPVPRPGRPGVACSSWPGRQGGVDAGHRPVGRRADRDQRHLRPARRWCGGSCWRSRASLDIPNGTGGIATGFRDHLQPARARRPRPDRLLAAVRVPRACSEPGSAPARWPSGSSTTSSPTRRGPGWSTWPIPLPQAGQRTLNRDVPAIGVVAHLRLRVTVTRS